MRREGRVHPHPDDSKPTAKVDPLELKRLLGKAPPPPPRPRLPSVGVAELQDEVATDVIPILELTAEDLKPRSPSIPSLATYHMVSMMPRPYPVEALAIAPRGSRPKLISEKIVALGKHHGLTLGFVLGAMLAACVFVLFG